METHAITLMADAVRCTVVDAAQQPAARPLLTRAVPVELDIILLDHSGTPYAEDYLAGFAWCLVVNRASGAQTPPPLRTSVVEVVPGGLRAVLDQMDTVELREVFQAGTTIALDVELWGVRDGMDEWVIQFPVFVRDRRERLGVPRNVSIDYYTKREVDSLLGPSCRQAVRRPTLWAIARISGASRRERQCGLSGATRMI